MMPNADVVLKKTYSVAGDGDITVSITIGEGQFGLSAVTLDGKQLIKASGTIAALHLGQGNAIKGKALVVRSVVNDVLSATNNMSVTYRLSGGPQPASFTAQGAVQNEGDPLVFEADIALA